MNSQVIILTVLSIHPTSVGKPEGTKSLGRCNGGCNHHTYTFNHSFYKRKARCLLIKWYEGISVSKCLRTWLNFSFTSCVQMLTLTPQSVTKTQYARRLNNNKHVDHATPTWELSTTDWKQEENADTPVTMPLYSCTHQKYN
jgi:hypothetical protein